MTLASGYQRIPVSAGEIEVSVFQPKEETDTAILLLHEGLGCITTWRDFPQRLCSATGYQVIVYSRFGYGFSSPCSLPRPIDYMEQEAQGPLPQLIQEIDAARLILLGHSDGASITAIYAGGIADARLDRIVLIAPHFFTETKALEAIKQAAVSYQEGFLRQMLEKHHGENVDTAFFGWNKAWLNPDFWHWNISQFLTSISVPTLLIQGTDDQYGTEAQLLVAEEKIPARVETQVLTGLTHSPHLERPETIIHLIEQFCAIPGRQIP